MKLINYLRLKLNLNKKEVIKYFNKKDIFVNNERCQNFDIELKELDVISYENKSYIYKEHIYLMLNKPKGYICSKVDEAYPSLLKIVPDEFQRADLDIVGRLDQDTEGLIFLSTDGIFLHKITSPKKKITKTYYVEHLNPLKEIDISNGITFKDYQTDKIALKKLTPSSSLITITDGKYHEVKKIIQYLDSKVTYLKRIEIGTISLGDLATGGIKELTKEEVDSLIN